ncbi:hypothetical protein BVRB_9g205730 [Beta vulgaris subsp. vulgaris]|nr:hypothetical protein BVRB_9g205730 [Beta vulgaris subsp. vulgaris]
MSVKEQVLLFLYVLGHNVRFRDVGGRFFRSSWTIHCYFHIVLQAILRLYPYVVKPPATDLQPEILNNSRFFPWFEDFIGAIDGTHVRASVPLDMQERFRGRKDKTTQNVLAAVDFDLKFTYVLAGWEGSAHDSRVLGDALKKGFNVPEGKYYLADAGYGDRKGFMPPFRRVRYHLKEYANNAPENERELFNLRHSSLRMCIERAFGVLKKRFHVLDAEPFWSFETQVDVVLACCVKEEKKANFRWTKPMSKELLEFLAEEVRKGKRPNNTFRTSSFIAAAKMISEKFHTTCTADHVENHMRTVRSSWGIISQVRGRSGFGGNDNVKMVTASPTTYDAYIQTSSGQPSTVETEPTKSDSATSFEPRSHRKRSRVEEEEGDLQHISAQLGEVVTALKIFSQNQLDVQKLYDEIMKMDDVEEAVRVAAFDHLVEHEMLAKAFLTKSEPLRKLWLQNFVKSLL